MAIRYLVTLEYLDYSDSHSIFKFEGNIKIIAVTYIRLDGLLGTSILAF
jgi:hypothetical protein